jgi:8-oxo-dGTP diphosphatase
MKHSDPQFGVRLQNAAYLDRPGAYAVIRASDSKLAFVRGKAGRLFLPGGSLRPGEPREDALLREIMEEGWSACILDMVGRATQFVFAEGEGYFAIRAAYFRAALIERRTTICEHEIVWLSAGATASSLARESDAWAISLVCNSK